MLHWEELKTEMLQKIKFSAKTCCCTVKTMNKRNRQICLGGWRCLRVKWGKTWKNKINSNPAWCFLQTLNEWIINLISSILNEESNKWHFCGFMSIRRTDVELLSLHPVSTATVANIFRKLGVTFGASAIFCSFTAHTRVEKYYLADQHD